MVIRFYEIYKSKMFHPHLVMTGGAFYSNFTCITIPPGEWSGPRHFGD